MSGARRGANAIAAYDLFIGRDGRLIDPLHGDEGGASSSSALADLATPDLILRIGDLPVSKPLRAWLAGPAAAAAQVMLTPEAVWADEPAPTLASLRYFRPVETGVGGGR